MPSSGTISPCNANTVVLVRCKAQDASRTLVACEITPIGSVSNLDGEFRLRPGAACMSGVCMPTKLHRLIRSQIQCLLESLPYLHQGLSSCTLSTFVLSHGSCPQSDPKECLPDVENDAHHFVVIVFFEGLPNCRELGMEPELIDVDAFLVFKLV
jgi:hypothetical protein